MSRIRRPLLSLAAYVLLIFALSSIPSLRAPGPDFLPKDKIAHFVEYFILGVLVFKNIGWSVSRTRYATFGFLVAVCVSVAAMDEIYQSFIPGREMSILDWSADAFGAAVGSGIFVFTRLGRRPPETGTPPLRGGREGDAV
jgi:VanZ family protein